MLTFGRRPATSRPELIEIVSPSGGASSIAATEQALAALTLGEPCSLEVAATRDGPWFLARAASREQAQYLQRQLGAAYPQARLRRLAVDQADRLDPAVSEPGERVAACVLALVESPALPLRTFTDGDPRQAEPDPMLGILAAMTDLPEGWRALSQLVLHPAPADWARGYLPLTVEQPTTPEPSASRPPVWDPTVLALAGAGAVAAVAVQGHRWYAEGEWLLVALWALGLGAGVASLVWLARRLRPRPLPHPQLVREKLSAPAYRAQLRLAVFAPGHAPVPALRAQLERLAATYRAFDLPRGNRLAPRRLKVAADCGALTARRATGPSSLLNLRELASLWHLPRLPADALLVERASGRQPLPLPSTVARGCPIGTAEHQGRSIRVALPDELLRSNLLLVAKTRRGKSSLLLRIAQYLMERPALPERPTLVLVDPHQDLAEATLGLVPLSRQDQVAYLDLAERRRPFGLNLLDTALFRDRDKAVSNTLTVFRREFDRFWGPRMEDAFRFALLTLYEANQTLCSRAQNGPDRQHTVLQVPAVLSDPAFRAQVLQGVRDPMVHDWWARFERLDLHLRIETINPVLTKVHHFAGSSVARNIIGQPRSTVDPIAWLGSGAVVLINTAKGTVGEETAALVGGTLLNLLALAVAEQARLGPGRRHPVAVLVDEFHTIPGADYEAFLSELGKYGANLVLATQSLARLDTLDREHGRALRPSVFANLDGLFAFQTSAEDARYLVRELGPEVDEADLVGLDDYRCYVRLSASGERLPVFAARLDPPPRPDPALCHQLAAASAARYGRDCREVEADLATSLARLEALRMEPSPSFEQRNGRQGQEKATRDLPRPRNEHRPTSKKRPDTIRVADSHRFAVDSDGSPGPGDASRQRSDR